VGDVSDGDSEFEDDKNDDVFKIGISDNDDKGD